MDKKVSQWITQGQTTLGRQGVDTHPFAGTSQSFESNDAIDFGKQGVILSHADIVPWMQFGSQLPHEYIACRNRLSAKALDTAPLAIAVPAVS